MTKVIEANANDEVAFTEARTYARKSGSRIVEIRSDGEKVHMVIR